MMLGAAWILLTAAAPLRAADELGPLVDSYDAAVRAFVESSGKAGGAIDLTKHPANETLPQVQAYAETHAGTPQAMPALVWMLKNARNAAGIPTGGKVAVKWAVDRLARDHLGDPAIKDALALMRYLSFQLGHEHLMNIYQAVTERNQDRAVQAQAWLYIAQTHFVLGAGGEGASRDGQTPRQQAKAILKSLIKDYAGTPAAEEAASLIKTTQGTGIGMEAPDIVGPDADGKEIRMSQFHGQVVLLHFWGFW